MNHKIEEETKVWSIWEVECFDKDGNFKWKDGFKNLVTNEGLNDLLDKYFKGSTYTAAFYIGLKKSGTIDAADTLPSHAGWQEVNEYSGGNRATLTLGSVASQSVNNSASKGVFNVTASVSVAGAFLATSQAISASSGVLYAAGDFGSVRSLQNGDTLNVTITLTAASG